MLSEYFPLSGPAGLHHMLAFVHAIKLAPNLSNVTQVIAKRELPCRYVYPRVD